MFDAGAIEARLTLKTDEFDKTFNAKKAEVKRFEDEPHKVKISAVFDNGSLSKARTMFAQLDNQLSRDAANRLRSSPQGSVLGTLNALFSPHPVTGSPTAMQSSTQGALGKMLNAPTNTTTNTTKSDTVIDDIVKVNKDDARAKGAEAAKAAEDGADAEAAKSRGSFFSKLFSGGFGTSGKSKKGSGGGEGGGIGQALDSGILGGALPGILGMGALKSSLVGLGGAAVGALPALTAAGLGVGVIGGGAAALIASNAKLKAQAEGTLKSIESVFENAATPLLKPLQQAFSSLGGFFKQIGPLLKSVFSAAAPLVKPLTDGLEGLVKGILPGLVSILKAAAPAMAVFAGFLAQFGGAFGKMLSIFSTVLGPSSVLLKALLDIVSALLPFIGQLAKVLANTLAPIFLAFAGAVKQLIGPLGQIIGIVAQFAGAVLGDLTSVFGSLATFLGDLAPSITILGKALGNVFTVLENTGVFATLGNVLEGLAGPLAGLINALVKGIAPALPVIIGLFSKFLGVIVVLLDAGLGVLLVALTKLVTFLSPMLPLLTEIIAGIKLWTIVQGLLDVALADNPIGLVVLAIAALVGAVVLLVDHWSAVWKTIKSVAEDAWNFVWHGFGKFLLPLLGPAGLIALGVIELYQHWSQIWGAIKSVASAAWGWIDTKLVQPLHNGLTDIVGWFESLPGKIISALSGLAGDLLSIGKNAMSSLIGGLENAIPGGHAIGGFIGGALNAIGFANGGLLTEPIVGFGTNTGQVYTLAEQGPEWVVPTTGGAAGGATGSSSQLAGIINIMQPEGASLGQAFSELTYQLAVAKQRGYVGAGSLGG